MITRWIREGKTVAVGRLLRTERKFATNVYGYDASQCASFLPAARTLHDRNAHIEPDSRNRNR